MLGIRAIATANRENLQKLGPSIVNVRFRIGVAGCRVRTSLNIGNDSPVVRIISTNRTGKIRIVSQLLLSWGAVIDSPDSIVAIAFRRDSGELDSLHVQARIFPSSACISESLTANGRVPTLSFQLRSLTHVRVVARPSFRTTQLKPLRPE